MDRFPSLAFGASLVASAAMAWIGELAGGSGWYVWSASGGAAAWAFFFVAFRVAPSRNAFVKWSSVCILAALGLMSALGPLMSGDEPLRALTGVFMFGFAAYFARVPVALMAKDLESGVAAA